MHLCLLPTMKQQGVARSPTGAQLPACSLRVISPNTCSRVKCARVLVLKQGYFLKDHTTEELHKYHVQEKKH